ncbi:MAG: hypothetical protein ACRER5_13730 [Pseudomonas sp.]
MKKTLIITLASLSATALADTPEGWLSADNPSAYTLGAMEFELNVGGVAVNDTLDVFDVRGDLLAGNRSLEGDSGDLSGSVIDLQFGVTSFLTAFYRRQDTDMTVDVGEVRSANLLSLDDELSTETSSYGLKWNIYESGRGNGNWTATSLELTRSEGSSDDFSGTFDRVTLSNSLEIIFNTPATFRLQDMEDEAWKARLLHTFPLSRNITSSIWGSYSETEATSGTGSTITSASLAPAFEQAFKVENKQYTVGASVNWQITPRIPLQLSYEYIRIQDTDHTVQVNPSNVLLPGFLRADNLTSMDHDDNHTLTGRLSFWITPQVTVSVTGKVFSNQFLGVIPHYQNPLAGSFSDEPYGYAGLHLGIKL